MNDLESLLKEVEAKPVASRLTSTARGASPAQSRSGAGSEGATKPPLRTLSKSGGPTPPRNAGSTGPGDQNDRYGTGPSLESVSEVASPTSPNKTSAMSRLDALFSSLDADMAAAMDSIARPKKDSQPSQLKPLQVQPQLPPPQSVSSGRNRPPPSVDAINDDIEALERELRAESARRTGSNAGRGGPGPQGKRNRSASSSGSRPPQENMMGGPSNPPQPRSQQQQQQQQHKPTGSPYNQGSGYLSPGRGGMSGPPSPPATPLMPESPTVISNIRGGNPASGPSKPMQSMSNPQAAPLMPQQQQSQPVCSACSLAITEGIVVNALGRAWHPSHFVCSGCEAPLDPASFFEREDEPFCETCFKGVFAATCGYCDGAITEGCISALGATWHPHHFFCSCCGKLFPPGTGFLEKDNKAYCEDDYFSLFATLCAGCGKPVVGEYVSAVDSEWHPDCFTCNECKEPFPTGIFFEFQGKPYCERHYEARTRTALAQDPYQQDYLQSPNGSMGSMGMGGYPYEDGNPHVCPTCRYEVAPQTLGTVLDSATSARFHPTHYVCCVCRTPAEGGVLLRVAMDGRETEGGRTKGNRVAARAANGLVCSKCVKK
ncbi:hypothetical protein HK101_009025 [Irineochytrium annulatum]|nr:hypothetical protein HK101_009025 [Irineochytrium annulatum]